MKWFRFYHEAYRNPKVQDMRPELFKFWVNFLCVASESETRGTVASEGHLRRALGLSKATVERYCRELENLDLLVRGSGEGALEEHRRNTEGLTPHDWHKLQPESDDSAKRQRDKRARDYDESPAIPSTEMSRDVSRDKNVTSCDSRARALLERESDGEEDSVFVSREREGDDLRDWEEALGELQGNKDLKLIGAMLKDSADVPSIAGFKGWQLIHAAHVIQAPGKPKTWEYFQGVARKASRQEFEAWHDAKPDEASGAVAIRAAPRRTYNDPTPEQAAEATRKLKERTAAGGQRRLG